MLIGAWRSDVCSSALPNEKGRGLEPSGRLELTWTNKHLRLISDPEGGYEWVEPTDPRVSEVRLLQEVGTVGDDAPDAANLLIEGDPLPPPPALNPPPHPPTRSPPRLRPAPTTPPPT